MKNCFKTLLKTEQKTISILYGVLTWQRHSGTQNKLQKHHSYRYAMTVYSVKTENLIFIWGPHGIDYTFITDHFFLGHIYFLSIKIIKSMRMVKSVLTIKSFMESILSSILQLLLLLGQGSQIVSIYNNSRTTPDQYLPDRTPSSVRAPIFPIHTSKRGQLQKVKVWHPIRPQQHLD